MVTHSSDQSEQLPSDTERHTTQAAAEAANEGVSLEVEHSGGPIGVYLLDSPYYDNRNGNPNPTWKLSRIPDIREAENFQIEDLSREDPCPRTNPGYSGFGNPHPILRFAIGVPTGETAAYYEATLEVVGNTAGQRQAVWHLPRAEQPDGADVAVIRRLGLCDRLP